MMRSSTLLISSVILILAFVLVTPPAHVLASPVSQHPQLGHFLNKRSLFTSIGRMARRVFIREADDVARRAGQNTEQRAPMSILKRDDTGFDGSSLYKSDAELKIDLAAAPVVKRVNSGNKATADETPNARSNPGDETSTDAGQSSGASKVTDPPASGSQPQQYVQRSLDSVMMTAMVGGTIAGPILQAQASNQASDLAKKVQEQQEKMNNASLCLLLGQGVTCDPYQEPKGSDLLVGHAIL